jgi:hypothetical protein
MEWTLCAVGGCTSGAWPFIASLALSRELGSRNEGEHAMPSLVSPGKTPTAPWSDSAAKCRMVAAQPALRTITGALPLGLGGCTRVLGHADTDVVDATSPSNT